MYVISRAGESIDEKFGPLRCSLDKNDQLVEEILAGWLKLVPPGMLVK